MNQRIRKTYSTEFKVKVVLEAFKGQRTINEISSQYGIHPNQVLQWKKQAVESLPEVFSSRRVRAAAAEEALQEQLYQQIGRLKVELDWLKKKVGLFA
jgi:transposase-like protein